VNYEQMQQLYSKHQASGFTILAFPCNQFGRQEPGTNEEIYTFAHDKYKATFPLFAKIDVNGSTAHPIFKFLRAKLTGTLGSRIKWNFTKFLCDRDGIPVKRYGPPTKPMSFENDIIELLAKPATTTVSSDPSSLSTSSSSSSTTTTTTTS